MKNKLYTKISNEFAQIFEEKIKSAKTIAITSHFSPDDDSISSILSIYYYLTNYLKISKEKVKILYTGDRHNKWSYFKNFKEINFVKDIANETKDIEVMILLDGSFWSRFSKDEDVSVFKGLTFCIDHHPVEKAQFNFHLNVKEATSTAEIVYKLLYSDKKLDKTASETLLLGILGDTGNLEYINADKAGVLGIAEKLIRAGGIDIQTFKALYNKMNPSEFKCLSELMANSEIKLISGWPKFMVAFIDMDFVKKNNISDNETSSAASVFAQYLRAVEGVDWGFVVRAKSGDQTHSISFRSQPGSVNVREMAEKIGGGGHDRAAGGKIDTPNTKEALKIILDWMKENKPTFS